MKIKLKVKEFIKRILCLVMLVVLLTPNYKVYGATQEQVGTAIASFAIDFCNKYGTRVHWYDVNLSDPSSYGKRAAAYSEAVIGSMQDYYMDCVGWVSYAIHHATGLENEGANSGRGGFVTPTSGGRNFQGFDDVTGQELKPGDILANDHHVMVYVGNDKIIDSRSKNGLTYTTLDEYGKINKTGDSDIRRVYKKVFRVSALTAAGVNSSDLAPIVPGINANSDKKKKDYGYRGLPSKGEYVGSQGTLNLLKSIINVLSQIADYLVGLMTLGIKIQLIGWTTIFENLVTDVVNEITGTEIESQEEQEEQNTAETVNSTETNEDESEREDLYTPAATETVIGAAADKNDRITIEKIIYNEIPILDINIFNIEEAGGQKLKEDGTLAIVKKNIAKWYYVLRNLSIVILLIILIYIGIRMTITTAVDKKAQYKRYLKDWVVSFIIVFFIHYIMVFVININEFLLELVKDSAPR